MFLRGFSFTIPFPPLVAVVTETTVHFSLRENREREKSHFSPDFFSLFANVELRKSSG